MTSSDKVIQDLVTERSYTTEKTHQSLVWFLILVFILSLLESLPTAAAPSIVGMVEGFSLRKKKELVGDWGTKK